MCFRCGQLEVQKTDFCHVEQMQQIPSLWAVFLQGLSIRSSLHYDAKPYSLRSVLMIVTQRRVNSDGIQENEAAQKPHQQSNHMTKREASLKPLPAKKERLLQEKYFHSLISGSCDCYPNKE